MKNRHKHNSDVLRSNSFEGLAFYKDILIGLLIVAGICNFIFGEFIMSSVVFATAAIASNNFKAFTFAN